MTTEIINSRKLLLTVDNYYVWSMAMEGKLDMIEALDIVLGYETIPIEDEIKISEFNKLNRKAFNLILDYLDTDNLSYVAGALSPNDKRNGYALWNLLRDHYQGNDFVNKTLAFSQFNDVKFENNVIEFVNKICTTVQKMKLTAFKMEEETIIILTLVKLPSSFDYLKKATDYENKTVDYLLKKLEQDFAQDSISSTSDVTLNQEMAALFSSRPACIHCKKTSHNSNNCWVKYPERAPKYNSQENKKQEEIHYYSI